MLSLPLDWEPPKSEAANPSSGMPKERQSSGFPAWFRDGHQEKCVWDSIILSKPFIAALFVSVIAAELPSLPPSLPAKDLARGRSNQFFIFIFFVVLWAGELRNEGGLQGAELGSHSLWSSRIHHPNHSAGPHFTTLHYLLAGISGLIPVRGLVLFSFF